MPEVADHATVERRGLMASAATAAVMAAAGISAGVLADSQIILLDGFYALVGLLLAWLGLHAGRLIDEGPTERYPFGRETLGPLVVGIQGLVLLGSLGYAGLEAIQTIASGGVAAATGIGLVYAGLTLVASMGIAAWLRRHQAGSDLLSAEAIQWRASAVLSLVMLVGFGLAALLLSMDQNDAAAFVDPTLVLVAVLLLGPTPVRMIRASLRELLEGTPGDEVSVPSKRPWPRSANDTTCPSRRCAWASSVGSSTWNWTSWSVSRMAGQWETPTEFDVSWRPTCVSRARCCG